MKYLISAMFIVAAIIHLMPLSGVLGSERLFALYGLSIDEPNLAILMRHRAVLLGMLGVFFLVAAFQPALQPLAFIAGFISVVPFLWLAWSTGGYNSQVGRVVTADVVVLVSLVIGSAAYLYLANRG
jgi:hypothetical protein